MTASDELLQLFHVPHDQAVVMHKDCRPSFPMLLLCTQWLLALKQDSMPRTGQLPTGQVLPDTGSTNTCTADAEGVSERAGRN